MEHYAVLFGARVAKCSFIRLAFLDATVGRRLRGVAIYQISYGIRMSSTYWLNTR